MMEFTLIKYITISVQLSMILLIFKWKVIISTLIKFTGIKTI